MIVLGCDNNNITLGINLVQAKMLLSLMRTITLQQLVVASEEVQKDGFPVIATDTEAARSSFVSVTGMYVNSMVHSSKAQELRTAQPETEQPAEPNDEENPKQEPPKETVN